MTKPSRAARSSSVPLRQFTDFYVKAFFEDIKALNIEPADVYPRATDHIPEMVALIKTLMAKGYAYRGEDGSIYYAVCKFPDYGKLSNIKVCRTQSRRKSKPRRIRQRRSPRLRAVESLDA